MEMFTQSMAPRHDAFRTSSPELVDHVFWSSNLVEDSAETHARILAAITDTTEFDDDSHASGMVLKYDDIGIGVRWNIAWATTGPKLCIEYVPLP